MSDLKQPNPDEFVESVATGGTIRPQLPYDLQVERNYELLQAATRIFTGSLLAEPGVQPAYWESYESSVAVAEALLAEIEKRNPLP